MGTLLQCFLKLVPCESARILLVEADTHLFLAREVQGCETNRRIPKTPSTFDAKDSEFLIHVLVGRDTLLIPNTAVEAGWAAFKGFSHLRSWLCVPLVAAQQVIGLFSLGDSSAQAFIQQHLRLAKSLAIPAAVAIQNARLYETVSETQPLTNDYATALIRSFDDHLEKVGVKGPRVDAFCDRITTCLNSANQDEYCEGLEKLGNLLGYQATRPKYRAATDNGWRGTFGNSKELITFETKIEHLASAEITPSHLGQAPNQLNRAIAEFAQLGYSIRGTIITNLTTIDAAAKSSAGAIRIISKSGVLELWERVRLLLSVYRGKWSIDDMSARLKRG